MSWPQAGWYGDPSMVAFGGHGSVEQNTLAHGGGCSEWQSPHQLVGQGQWADGSAMCNAGSPCAWPAQTAMYSNGTCTHAQGAPCSFQQSPAMRGSPGAAQSQWTCGGTAHGYSPMTMHASGGACVAGHGAYGHSWPQQSSPSAASPVAFGGWGTPAQAGWSSGPAGGAHSGACCTSGADACAAPMAHAQP